MDERSIEAIYDMSAARIRETDCCFHRYLYSQLDWSVRVLALSGPRGVGKTTIFLQHLKENPNEAEHSLYVSMDNLWLNPIELFDLAKYHIQQGGTSILIDEVHYLENWQKLIKNLYDNFKGLRVAYTGSSIFDLSDGVQLLESKGMKISELARAQEIAEEEAEMLKGKWHEYFD